MTNTIKYLAASVAALLPYCAVALPLGDIPGQTQLQSDTGNAVQKTCGGFVNNVGDLNPPGSTPANTPLWASCRAMVHNANDVLDNGEPTGFSFGLDAEQLSAAMQQIATEEFAATESMAAEISTNRLDPVSDRLSALRAGASGFSVSGFQPEADSGLLADGAWYQSQPGLRGASAGDEAPGSALSGFANINYGFGKRDGTDRTDEFDYTSYNITLGLDYRFGDNLVVGGALSYYDVDSEFADNPTVAGGDTEAKGFGGFVYSTWYSDSFYLDAMAGYSVSNYDLKRNINIQNFNDPDASIVETAKADPNSKDYTVSLGAGFDWNTGAMSWGPYLRATYLRVDIDSYQESGAEASGLNLDVASQDWSSLSTTLGGQFAYTISTSSGVLVPQLRVGWIHQFDNDATDITAVYVADPRNNVLTARTDDPDRDYAELGLAVSSVFQGGGQVFFSYDTLLGFENLTSHLFTLGGRWEF